MASLGNRWLLCVSLAMLSTIYNMWSCLAQPGCPPGPSLPRCHIPYKMKGGVMVRSAIQCVWDPGPPSETPSVYTLHWKFADCDEQEVRGSNRSAFIPPARVPSHTELSLWVRAESQHCSADSPMSSFNTASIMKSAAPNIKKHSLDPPLEIYWESNCIKQGLSEGSCQVRHRLARDQEVWSENEEQFHGMYYLEKARPYSGYEFQVRCACLGRLLSDWSPAYQVETPGAAPVGLLDLWSDCTTPSKTPECVLMWKRLPRWQAGGEILGYVVTSSHTDGTATVVNTSSVVARTSTSTDHSTCDGTRCRLNGTLGGVAAVNISAYTAHGSTTPARLHVPLPGQESSGEALQLKFNSEGLVVSWHLSTQHINRQSEFVVQYKQAGLPPTQGFDWIRVDRNQTSATLTGQFEEYIAYQVALFSVFPNGSIDHISSAVGYTRQGIPPKVPLFEVVANKDNSVTLTWKGIPLTERRGHILCYQIGVGNQTVYNVSEMQGDENQSFLLEDLKPGQTYQAWIRAVTEAGPGTNSTKDFIIHELEPFDYRIMLFLFLFLPLVSLVFMKYFFRFFKEFVLKKVPEPSISHILMNAQLNGCWDHVAECDPVLSRVDIVEPPPEEERTRGRTADRGSRGPVEGVANLLEWAGSGDMATREECYSKMIDLDNDMVDTFSPDYEKHFIPTAEELMVF